MIIMNKGTWNILVMSTYSRKPKTRQRLAELLRATDDVITVENAATTLNLSRNETAKLLARWTENGWLTRIKRGLYIVVPLESISGETVSEDPWIISMAAFSPCYIGGWSAIEHWGMTEQIFNTTMIFSLSAPRQRRQTLVGVDYWILATNEDRMYGLTPVWRGRTKVQVSNPERTLVDSLDNPAVCGGLRQLDDVLHMYMESPEVDDDRLIEYSQRFQNGAVFKRLGFLVERSFPERKELLSACKRHMTTGLAKLDPTLTCNRIVNRWRLRVPINWVK